jgi:hypothetical protein
MVNPDKRVRENLFKFITAHDFVLTSKGYMVVYKAVYRKNNPKSNEQLFAEFLTNIYLLVKKKWRCSPNKYVIYRDAKTDEFKFTKLVTAEKWNEKELNIEILGNLGDLYEILINTRNKEDQVIYTDMHTRSMSIELGTPVRMERHECDSDPAIDCSCGLHVGATKYVERFADNDSIVLVCFVNPAHVIAVPDYDHSKMRVAEYFPFALAAYSNNKINIIKEAYLEDDYCEYEILDLEKSIKKIKAKELPYKSAKNAKKEERSMSELQKMLETRLVDIY